MRRLLASIVLFAGLTSTASAQVTYYLSEMIVLATNFCPKGTLPANGALLPINTYTALFELLGTTYGGNGTTTFALPIFRVHTPSGQALSACIVTAGVFPTQN